jgi:hypothetical protein
VRRELQDSVAPWKGSAYCNHPFAHLASDQISVPTNFEEKSCLGRSIRLSMNTLLDTCPTAGVFYNRS